MARTWAQLLDDYAATIAALEQRLDSDSWQHDVADFEPPHAVPLTAPSPAEKQRFDELHQRAARCHVRLRAELDSVRAELRTTGVRRSAAREYGAH